MRNYVGLFLVGVALAAVGCDAETLAKLGVLRQPVAGQSSAEPSDAPSPSVTPMETPAPTPDPTKLGAHWSGDYRVGVDSPEMASHSLSFRPDGKVDFVYRSLSTIKGTGEWAGDTLYITISDPWTNCGSSYRPVTITWTLRVFGTTLKGTERRQRDECWSYYGTDPAFDTTSTLTLVRATK